MMEGISRISGNQNDNMITSSPVDHTGHYPTAVDCTDMGQQVGEETSKNEQNEKEDDVNNDTTITEDQQHGGHWGSDSVTQALPEEPPEVAWGWVMVFGIGIALSVVRGLNKAISLFYEQLLQRFGESAAMTAGITSLAGTLEMVPSPLISALCNVTSHRTVGMLAGIMTCLGLVLTAFVPSLTLIYVTFSVLYGVGVAMFVIPATSMTSMYFTKNRAKANAVRSCFSGVGGVYMTQLFTLLSDEYGFTGTMIIVGALFLHLIPAAALMRPLEEPKKRSSTKGEKTEGNKSRVEDLEEEQETSLQENTNSSRDDSSIVNGLAVNNESIILDTKTDRQREGQVSINERSKGNRKPRLRGLRRCALLFGLQAFTNPQFSMLAILRSSFCIASAMNRGLMAGMALEIGYVKSQVTTMMSISFFVEVPLRLLGGVFFDLRVVRTRRILVYAMLAFTIGLASGCLPYVPVLIPSMALWIMLVSFNGIFTSQGPTATADIVPKSTLTSGIGLMRLVQGVGNLAGPFLGGVIHDITGSYKLGYVVAGSQLCFMSLIFLIITLCRSNSRRIIPFRITKSSVYIISDGIASP